MKLNFLSMVKGACMAVLGAMRFALYVVLLLTGRVVLPCASLLVVLGAVLFLFCLVFRRDLVTPMWAGVVVAVGGICVIVFYDHALRLVAPKDVVIVSEV
jgi:hypothetical protein